MNNLQVIATVNTHLLSQETLDLFFQNGASILRINGSHIQPSEIANYTKKIRECLGNKIRILVDLPGNKIRTSVLSQPIRLTAGKSFELTSEQLNYSQFIRNLKVGDILLANDSLFKFRVEAVEDNKVILYSYTDGLLTSNKGVHLTGRHLSLPFLFDRDRELIRESIRNGVDIVGLSFVRTAEDVREAKSLLEGSQVSVIVKVETQPAIENLDAILKEADEFLVDRGDLSCDVGIENIDQSQKFILRKAKRVRKKVYFATQFLHSMLNNNVPLIAEVCGLSDAIANGVYGIQLSEETAIGKHPVEVLKTVQKVYQASYKESLAFKKQESSPVLWLTGRSGAGKTTIAHELLNQLEVKGLKCCLVDGDDFRKFWDDDLGYSKEDRMRNLRNITFTAYQAAMSFDVVVVSSLSPYRDLRSFARKKISNFHEIYVNCSQQTCVERDPKGHYKKALTGEHKNFIGVSEEYEEPVSPELILNTEKASVFDCVKEIKNYLLNQ